MKSLRLIVFITLISTAIILADKTTEDVENTNVKTLDYQDSVKEIVKDLIFTWSSPLVYLKKRGYLKTPQLDFDMFHKDETSNIKDAKDTPANQRVARSNDDTGANDLGHLFRSLFSTDDNTISDKIKTKLGVPWDMNALKSSVHKEASKFYDKFYKKRNEQTPKNQQSEVDTDIDRQVAQLYPSVLPNPNNEHAAEDLKKEVLQSDNHKETNFLNGIAKLLSNRELLGKVKPLPVQAKESEKPELN